MPAPRKSKSPPPRTRRAPASAVRPSLRWQPRSRPPTSWRPSASEPGRRRQDRSRTATRTRCWLVVCLASSWSSSTSRSSTSRCRRSRTRSGFSTNGPAVGRQRLHAHVRRLPAARRARGSTCSAAAASSSPGSLLFAVASLVCAIRPRAGMLLGARALQGIGAASSPPPAWRSSPPPSPRGAPRNRALGAWGAIGGARRHLRACCSAAC